MWRPRGGCGSRSAKAAAAPLRRTGWRHFQDPGRRGPTSIPDYLAAYVDRMAPAIDRLRQVSLECRPALDVIRDHPHDGVCIYADPPYLGSVRSSRQYRVEMSHPAEHEQLAEALHDCTAAVVLSGYPSPLYDALYADWHRANLAAFTGQGNHATVRPAAAGRGRGRGGDGRRVEVLWSNRPLAAQPTLWTDPTEDSA